SPSSPRAAALAAVEAVTESDSAQPGAQDPLRPAHAAPSKSHALKTAARAAKTVPFTPATQPQMPQAPPRYHVARSANKNLPVYTDYKRGGNLHLTTVRKVTGDLHALRDELRTWLAKKDDDVKVNTLTQHVVVKGHHKDTIAEFLRGRGM
ncbi:mitochondrial large ribosomal subunit l49, partial [Stagonosporopsis vannaccii]